MSSDLQTREVPIGPTQGQLVTQMADKRASVARRVDSVRQLIAIQADTLYQALPRHLTRERFTRIILNSIRKTPKLLDCTPESFFGAVGKAAALGLELDGTLGYAYLIPFGDECTLVAGYKGLIDLCRRSGTISTVSMEVVHKGDHFQYQLGDQPFIRHTPNDEDPDRDKRPITHAYVVVELRDGGVQRKVWSAAKINTHKEKYSRSYKKPDSPWVTSWPVMAKKTVVRDMVNRGEIPASAEIQRLAIQEEIVEAASSPTPGLPYDPPTPEEYTDALDERAAKLEDKPPRKPRKKPAAETQVDPAVEKTDGVDDSDESIATDQQNRVDDYTTKAVDATSLAALKSLEAAMNSDGDLLPKAFRRVQKMIDARKAEFTGPK